MTCPSCGAEIGGADNYCEACGNALQAESSAGGAAKPSAQPGPPVCNCPPGEGKPDEEGYCENCGVRCFPRAAVPLRTEEAVDGRLAMVSDVGLRHKKNEDAGKIALGENGNIVLVVADGVSTSLNSASASSTAANIVGDILSGCKPEEDSEACMRLGIEAAHRAIIALPGSRADEDGPETTLVAALLQGDRLVVGWVGDSRAYMVDGNSEELLTVDDSWVEEVVLSGEFTREQAMADTRAHYVTQVLGMKDQELRVHLMRKTMEKDASLLLCSDGLWNYFQEGAGFADILGESAPAAGALDVCTQLVKLANEQGGHDNITAALLLPEPPG